MERGLNRRPQSKNRAFVFPPDDQPDYVNQPVKSRPLAGLFPCRSFLCPSVSNRIASKKRLNTSRPVMQACRRKGEREKMEMTGKRNIKPGKPRHTDTRSPAIIPKPISSIRKSLISGQIFGTRCDLLKKIFLFFQAPHQGTSTCPSMAPKPVRTKSICC